MPCCLFLSQYNTEMTSINKLQALVYKYNTEIQTMNSAVDILHNKWSHQFQFASVKWAEDEDATIGKHMVLHSAAQ